jgi:hypothetical protein
MKVPTRFPGERPAGSDTFMRIGGFVALMMVAAILWALCSLFSRARDEPVRCVYAADGIHTICGDPAD